MQAYTKKKNVGRAGEPECVTRVASSLCLKFVNQLRLAALRASGKSQHRPLNMSEHVALTQAVVRTEIATQVCPPAPRPRPPTSSVSVMFDHPEQKPVIWKT